MKNPIPLTCLILEPVAVVAEDLVAMIRDEMPEARFLIAATAEAAADSLIASKVDIAFVNLGPGELAHTDLVRRMEAAGVTVVLLETRPNALARPQRFLEMPFVQSAVARELRVVVRRMRRRGLA